MKKILLSVMSLIIALTTSIGFATSPQKPAKKIAIKKAEKKELKEKKVTKATKVKSKKTSAKKIHLTKKRKMLKRKGIAPVA